VDDGRVHVFPGNYEDYVWRKQGGQRPAAEADGEPAPKPAESAVSALPVEQGAAKSVDRRLNPIKLRQMKERRHAIEDEVTRLEVEIADYEAALANFVNIEETKRYTDLLNARRGDLETLMAEWEDVAQLIEANS
jgi:ATP-binding cassette subfamily F protein 3